MRFKIVVPNYNASKFIGACLLSIDSQMHRDFECLVVDDASTDGTDKVVLPFIKKSGSRFRYTRNARNVGPLANIWMAFTAMGCEKDPESVFMIVDGDDRLSTPDALSIIRKTYESGDVLTTYGNCVRDTGGPPLASPFPAGVAEKSAFRKHRNVSIAAPRTYKSKLWSRLRREDMIDPKTGHFYRAGCDVAFIVPALELAGHRYRCIKDVLYVVNTKNPLSDHVIRGREQRDNASRILGMKSYEMMK